LTRYPTQEKITSVKSEGPSALVVGTVIVATVAFVAPLWLLDTDWSYWLFVFGPLLLGALVAVVARGRARLLGIAAATFMPSESSG
jgi:cell division protein FtsW (lipid II flippase)